MKLTNREKQILQKYYAERIKSLSQNLKEMILQDKQNELGEAICKINGAGDRLVSLHYEYETDELKKSIKTE